MRSEHLRYARKRPSSSDSKSAPMKVARSTRRFTSSSKSFGLFLSDLIAILDGDEKAIVSMKAVLKSMILPLRIEDGEDELHVVLTSAEYKNATTIAELVGALAPCWNEFDCDLLQTLVRASHSEAAIEKVQEFLEGVDPDMPLVVRTSQHHTTELPDAAVTDLTAPSQSTLTPDEASQRAKRMIQLYSIPEGATVVIVRTSKEQITIAKMHDVKEATCHNLRVPKEAMLYIEALPGSVTLIFFISIKLIRYLRAQHLWLRELYSLRSHGVCEVIIPDQYHLIVPPLEVR